MKITDTHVYFWDGVFSNWYPSQFKLALTADGVNLEFNCAEQAFIAGKAIVFNDFAAAAEIMKLVKPKDQKAVGRRVNNFDQVVWFKVSPFSMYNAVAAKFLQNHEMGDELLETGNRTLVEASPYDRIWGVGMSEDDEDILDESKWLGLNWLGKTLEIVRTNLKISREQGLSYLPNSPDQFNVFQLS